MTTTAAPKAEFELRSDDWLASILGRPAARLAIHGVNLPDLSQLRAAIESKSWIAAAGCDEPSCFVDCKVDASRVDQVNCLSDLGMKVVDVNVTAELVQSPGLPRSAEKPPGIQVIESQQAAPLQLSEVLDLSATAFRYSRFHLDPQLDNAYANHLKRDWLENSIAGNRGDRVWLAIDETDRVSGFLTSLLPQSRRGESDSAIAVIDLIAVAPGAQGRGVGRTLTNAFIDHYASKGVSRFRVGTQVANLPAQRLYQSLGFRSISSTFVMHGHF